MKRTQRILSLLLAMILAFAVPAAADETRAAKHDATANYEDIVSGSSNPEGKPQGTWKAGNNTVYSLVDILPKEKILKTEGFSGGDYNYYQDSTSNNSYGAAINGPYKKSGKGFSVGNDIKFNKGFGTHPKRNQEEVYITIDVSAYTNEKGSYGCNTFYACVGLTNNASPGVYFQVFADYGDGSFKKIANSTVITGNKLGEFNVDITGVQKLKLVVITATAANDSSACAWLAPSIFKADPNIKEPTDVPEQKPAGIQKYEPTDNYEVLVWSKDNPSTRPYSTWKAGENEVYSLIDLIPTEKIVMTENNAGGDYEYYTDSTTANEYGAAINGPFKRSSKGYTVGGNVSFVKGFGTHPKANQEVTYIELDVSEYTDLNGSYQCDTFYSCVGLTNTASAGVYFQVFADYGDGQFKLVGNSNAIKLTNIGEFNVDISGVKTLRLVVITATESNSSSASAWLNPCIFKADPAAKKFSYKEHDPYEEYATEDPANIPSVTAPVTSMQNANYNSGVVAILIGASVAVLVIAAAVVLIVLKRKKAGKE